MLNFAVAFKWQLIFRSLSMKTFLAFQIFRSPRHRGDTPVVSDTLVTRSDYSPSPMGSYKNKRRI